MSGPRIPLSAQQRQLLRQQRQSGAAPFRTCCAVEVEGGLDRERLRAALEDRVARHEILRTTFRQQPSEDAIAEVGSAAGRVVWNENGGAVDDYAVRAALEGSGPDRHVLRLDVPALWADSRGLECLVRETLQAYEALAAGRATPEVPMQFGVLAQWQNEILATEEAELGKRFWARQDLSSLAAARLPWEKPLPAAPPFAPCSVPVPLPARLSPAGLDAGELLQACWQVLLWRLIGGKEMIVGTTLDGRVYEAVDDAVGPFAKDLPVRLRLEPETPFATIAARLADRLAEADNWQEYFAWDDLQSGLGEAGPLFFPFAFEFRATPAPFGAGGLRCRFLSLQGCHDRFRVKLRAADLATAEIFYDASFLDAPEAERLAEELATLAGAAAKEPRRAIGELPLVGPGERQLLLDLAGTATPPPSQPLHGAFEEQAARSPHLPAVVAGKIETTYGELNGRANRLARHLRALGIREGDLVGALLGRSAAMPAAILGIVKSGAAYLPLDPSYPAERLAFMMRDSQIRWLVSEGELPAGLQPEGAELIQLDRDADAIARHADENPEVSLEPASPAYVMYTSGSTGEPRGVVIAHGCGAHYVQALQQRLGLGPGDRCLHTASVSFSSSVRQLFVPLSHGAAVVVATAEQRIDPPALFREVRDRGVTVVDLVPSHWRGSYRALQGLEPEALRELLANRLRLGLSASEPLLSDLPAAWRAILPGQVRLINMYGQTETTGIVATHPIPAEEAVGVVPVGRPLPDTALYLLAGPGDLAPVGMAGELCASGSGLGQGYLGRPADTAERFVPDPFGALPGGRLYRTGDLGRFRADGTLEFLGRKDQQMKVRGIRVEPGEVEVALARCEGVREAAVALHRDGTAGVERLVAYLVTDGRPLPAPEELREHLRQVLPEHMVPAVFVRLESLPLTPTGKLDRGALPVPTREAGVQAPYVAPRNATERQLAEIWQETLGVEKVGVLESFFALGGHSMLAVMVVSRVRQAFGVELPVGVLFRAPTVAGLAQEIDRAGESARSAPSLGTIAPAASEEQLLAGLDQMSDEQVSTLLAQMLAQQEER